MTVENTPSSEAAQPLPKWIFYFGCLLTAIGMIAGLIGILSPTQFFNDFPNFSQWEEISYVTTGWGVRNLAMGAAMILALWLKLPSVIGVVFSMRFLTELGDLINTLATGHGSMGTSLIIIAAGWIVFFLIPEALAAKWGLRTALTQNQQ